MTAIDYSKDQTLDIGMMLLEGEKATMSRLGTFDEMLGCNKCNAIHHRDTRYGPYVGAEDGSIRVPIKMFGRTKYDKSTCKDYQITGSKSNTSITFEGGPFVVAIKLQLKLGFGSSPKCKIE